MEYDAAPDHCLSECLSKEEEDDTEHYGDDKDSYGCWVGGCHICHPLLTDFQPDVEDEGDSTAWRITYFSYKFCAVASKRRAVNNLVVEHACTLVDCSGCRRTGVDAGKLSRIRLIKVYVLVGLITRTDATLLTRRIKWVQEQVRFTINETITSNDEDSDPGKEEKHAAKPISTLPRLDWPLHQ